mmetsp:Transcript_13239/g.15168  ORF Transcript_13239/g.15168 Transcript_13239/m.15168 type:complete len:151 (+) Transcript_13239:50-502(+)
MRAQEEIVDAGIALTAFLFFLIFFCCVSDWISIKSCCDRIMDCICCTCCRKSIPPRAPSYNDLEELLFNAEESTGGRLADNTTTTNQQQRQRRGEEEKEGDNNDEITMDNFFCDVLKQQPNNKKKKKIERQDSNNNNDTNNNNSIAEPLL